MSAYEQPQEYLPSFSSSDFLTSSDNLSLAKANSLYARLAGSNIMSGLNTFNDAISVMGINISSNVSSTLTNINIGSTSNSSGEYNICIGKFTGSLLSDGYNNIAVGSSALAVITTGNSNTAIGFSAGNNLDTSSSGNVNIGDASSGLNTCVGCVSIGANSVASISNSVAIGNASHANKLNSIAIGYNTIADYNNSIVIGTGLSTSAVNQIVLGSTNETTQIAGLLNVIKTATFTLPSFLSAPIMNYTSFSPIANSQGHNTTSATLISNSLTLVNTVYQVATITIVDIGLYLVDGYFKTSTSTANSTVYIILNTSVAQNSASQTTFCNGGATQTLNPKISFLFNITTANTIIYLCGYIPTGGVVPVLISTTQIRATRL